MAMREAIMSEMQKASPRRFMQEAYAYLHDMQHGGFNPHVWVVRGAVFFILVCRNFDLNVREVLELAERHIRVADSLGTNEVHGYKRMLKEKLR